MYLKQIELENFKSFGGKMTIPLKEGYLAVTGPNGSGKSNIADAILFVLGPKSSKAIRAGKLTDLIFDGGKSKARADFTKVSLVFDNSDGILPWNDATVRLTRLVKLAANREDYSSHFFINDQKSSMTEFDNLLSRARISADGYNLVQQGDVTRIVQMSTVERRRILDGISGISSYDADISRSASERSEIEGDLERINILRGELERQLDELSKAMEDARRYLDIQKRRDMAKAQLVFRGIEDEEAGIAAHEQNIVDIRAEIGAMEERASGLREEMRLCDERIAKLERDIEAKAGPDYARMREEHTSKRVDLAALEDKQEKLADDNEEMSGKVEEDREVLAEYEKDIGTLNESIREAAIARDAKTEAKRKADDEVRRINGELASKGGEHGRLQARLNGLEPMIDSESARNAECAARIAGLDARKSELSRLLAQAEQDVDETVFEIKDYEWQLSEIEKQGRENGSDAILEKIEAKTAEIRQLEKQESDLMDAATRLGHEYNRLNAEKKAEDRVRGSEAVRFVLDLRDMRKINGIHGTIAELASVDKKYETALAVAAGGKMQAIVVDDDQVGEAVLTAVKKADAGRVTVLPLNKMIAGKPRGPAILASKNTEGFAIDFLEFDEMFRPAFWYVLGDTVVAEDLRTARANMGGVRIVTMSGELIEMSGAMTGGSTRQFNMKFGGASSGKLEEAAARYHRANDSLAELRTQLSAKRAEMRSLDDQLREARGRSADTKAEIGRLESQLGVARKTKADREATQAERRRSYDGAVAEYAEAVAEKEECDAALKRLREDRADIRARIEEIAPAETQAALQKATGESFELLNEISALTDSISTLNSELSGKVFGRDQTSAEIAELSGKIERNRAAIEQKQKAIDALGIEIDAIARIIGEMESGIRDLRIEKDAEVNARHGFDKELQSATSGIQAKAGLIGTIEAEIGIAKERKASYEEEAGEIDFEVERPLPTMDVLNRTIKGCEQQLARIGNVNLNAINEYEAKKIRYDSYRADSEKIESRIKELDSLMDDLNSKKKGLFMKTYDGIDVNFREIYSELSGGGEAYMKLENEMDPFSGGLSINAKPKNGKLLRLEALSGGEKSLTALAFIFAIQEYQPSPFYVLDEVDMFLDAVNAEMVAKRVRKSSAKVQFIQVSLRKVTLAQAEHLLGVARQPSGVSKVIIQPDFAEVSQYENSARQATEADGTDGPQ